MSVMGKLKNILFTEEEETEEIPVIKENPSPTVHETKSSVEEEITRFKNFNYEEEKKKVEEKNETPVIKEEAPKKEEKSPFQVFDEEEFDRLAALNKTRLIERDRRLREEKERKRDFIEKREVKESIKEEVKFVPSPVISPVYGVLDKNYTKDDILPRASSEGTLPKVMDVDQVRKKAFGTLESIEKNITDELDDVKITSFEDEVEENNDVVITNDIEVVDDKDETTSDDKEITKPLPKVNKEKEEKNEVDVQEVIDDVKKEDEEIENDLFELIDSMYQDEEGEK